MSETHFARAMVPRWGMSERLGMVKLAPCENPYLASLDGGFEGPKSFSEATARIIDADVHRIAESHETARRLLAEYRAALDAIADALLERETLEEKQILEVTRLPAAPALETGKLSVLGEPRSS